jgi:hypothetical protein
MNITGKSIDTFVGNVVGTFDDYFGAQDSEERDLHFIKLTTFYMDGCTFGILQEFTIFTDVMDGVAQKDANEGHKVFYNHLLNCLSDEAKTLYNEYEKNRSESNDD